MRHRRRTRPCKTFTQLLFKRLVQSHPSIEVSVKSNVLTVSCVNTNLNKADHGARNGEASRVGPVVSFALAARPEFKSIHTIRVQYLARSKPNGAAKIVDTIDFRKAPDGGFVFHTT